MAKPLRFRVGDWRVAPELNQLDKDGRIVRLEPQAMDLLVLLITRAPEVVSTEDVVREVWNGRAIGDGQIYRRIAEIRAAFGDDSRKPVYLETIPKRGYRLVASVEPLEKMSFAGSYLPSRWQRLAAVAAVVTFTALALFILSDYRPGRSTVIAVLPFANTSVEAAQSYLGESIADELIHALSSTRDLTVIARTSSFSFVNTNNDVADISERLGATVVLEGSVRRRDGQLQVRAQLVDSVTSHVLWSEAFDRPFSDLISIERSIAQEVAGRLLRDDAEISRITAALPQVANISAYEYYLLGQYRMSTPSGLTRDWSITDANRTIEYFRRATVLDPGFARAHAGLASALLRRTLIGTGLSVQKEVAPDVAEEALAAIDRAEALDPDLAEVLYARGFALRVLEGNHDRGLELYRQALTLDSSLTDAYIGLGISLRNQEGVAALQKAAELDPLSGVPHRWLHLRLSGLGDLEQAAFHLERYIELEPDSFEALQASALDQWITGQADEAVRILRAGLGDPDLRHEEFRIRLSLARAYLDLNDHLQAESELQHLEQPVEPFLASEVADARLQLALAEGSLEDVAALVHTWNGANELTGLYEMVIGHDDHARDAFGTTRRDLLSPAGRYVRFGYHPAVNAAHLELRSGNETSASQILEAVRQELDTALELRYVAGGAYYLLASIHAIEGDREQALSALGEAIHHGWTNHWYAVLDPNLETLWDEPQFQETIADLKAEMDRRRRAI